MRRARTIAVIAMTIGASSSDAIAAGAGSLVGEPILAEPLGAIGFVDAFVPLGADAQGNCNYLMNWASPYNPNMVTQCLLTQLNGVQSPGCIPFYPSWGSPSVLEGGGLSSVCEGFDLLGVPQPVTIFASAAGGRIAGVVVYDDSTPLSFTVGP